VTGTTPGDLAPLEMTRLGPLILARASGTPAAAHTAHAPWEAFATLAPRAVADLEVLADWKIVVEQWLESPQPQQHFVKPNLLLDIRPAGALVLQVTPLAPGRSRIRRFDFAVRTQDKGRAARDPWPRRATTWLKAQIELAESTQAGLAGAADESAESGPASAALTQFRDSIAALLRAG
jgi:hypothetical protein